MGSISSNFSVNLLTLFSMLDHFRAPREKSPISKIVKVFN